MNIDYFGLTKVAFAGSILLFLLATLLNKDGKNLNQPIRWLGYIFYSLLPGALIGAIVQRATLDSKLAFDITVIASTLSLALIGKYLIVTEKENVVWGVVDGIFGGKSENGGSKYMPLSNGTKILRPGEHRERKIDFKSTNYSKAFDLELASITYITTISATYVPKLHSILLSLGKDETERKGVVEGNIIDISKQTLNDILSAMPIATAKNMLMTNKKILSEKLLEQVQNALLKKCGVKLTVLLVSDVNNTDEHAKAVSQRNAAAQVREQAIENLRAAHIKNPTIEQLNEQMLIVANITGIGDVSRKQFEIVNGKPSDIKDMNMLAHNGQHGDNNS